MKPNRRTGYTAGKKENCQGQPIGFSGIGLAQQLHLYLIVKYKRVWGKLRLFTCDVNIPGGKHMREFRGGISRTSGIWLRRTDFLRLNPRFVLIFFYSVWSTF